MKRKSTSFLKKRSKKLLIVRASDAAMIRLSSKSFLVLFFKKELLALLFVLPLPALAQEQAPTVSTAIVRAQTWQPSLEAVGSLRAARGADLAAELPGIVDWVGFDSGRDVEAGTLLLRLRPNDDAAKLAELQAAADLAASNLARDTKQYKAQAVSQATIDADDSHLRAARAQVAQQQAIMAERLVRAPFAGRLGLRQVDVGQYLPAGTMIVTLQALDPIYVDFYVPQQALATVRLGQVASLRVDTFPGRVFRAQVTAISPKLDPASRMAQIRATVANPDHGLLPGMFGTVTVAAGPPRQALTVPNAAVIYNPYGSAVFIVRGGIVHQALVKTGETRGNQVEIVSGLQAGDQVVSAGQIKLHDGSPVAINNAVQPSDAAAPQPVEE
jgi:membrane fusion protein (multidrug efflux system)